MKKWSLFHSFLFVNVTADGSDEADPPSSSSQQTKDGNQTEGRKTQRRP